MHADILASQMPQTLFLSQHLALGTGKKATEWDAGYMQNLIAQEGLCNDSMEGLSKGCYVKCWPQILTYFDTLLAQYLLKYSISPRTKKMSIRTLHWFVRVRYWTIYCPHSEIRICKYLSTHIYWAPLYASTVRLKNNSKDRSSLHFRESLLSSRRLMV